jgi:hypothetical protein
MLRFKAFSFPKPGAKRGAPTRAKMGHPGQATVKVKILRSDFFGRFFCAIENTPKKGRFSTSYSFSNSDAPTRTTFLGRSTIFG